MGSRRVLVMAPPFDLGSAKKLMGSLQCDALLVVGDDRACSELRKVSQPRAEVGSPGWPDALASARGLLDTWRKNIGAVCVLASDNQDLIQLMAWDEAGPPPPATPPVSGAQVSRVPQSKKPAAQTRKTAGRTRGRCVVPVWKLTPAPRWVLVIDESGKHFGRHGIRNSCLVGVLFPAGTEHSECSDIHLATDATSSETADRWWQELEQHPAGILGVHMVDVPDAPGQRWVDGIAEIVRWVLRLLPVAGAAKIEVWVEQRAEHKSGDSWRDLTRYLQAEVTALRPDAPEIFKSIRVVGKGQHPLLGYADLVAWTWGRSLRSRRPDRAARAVIRTHAQCFDSSRLSDLRDHWDRAALERWPTAGDWQELVKGALGSPLRGLFVKRVAEACVRDPALWRRYLDGVVAHLEGKAIDLGRLGTELEWLHANRPDGHALGPSERLVWLTARQWRLNNSGAVDGHVEAELAPASAALRDEVPRLACQADLVRAVHYTNRFEFVHASAVLEPWAQVSHRACGGRQHWGRVQSSLGQHAAFRGDQDSALTCFQAALDAFSGLSDERLARAETRHTATYAAIAATDSGLDRAQVHDWLKRALGVGLPPTLTELSPYAEHAWLRFLVHRRDGDAIHEEWIRHTLAQPERDGDQHPWPMIWAYRGLLRGEGEQAERLERAVKRIKAPVLAYQELVIRRLAGQKVQVDPVLRASLASAPWRWVDDDRLLGVELLRAALPFNFR